MKVDSVRSGSQVIDNQFDATRVLGDVQNRTVVGAALVFGMQGRGAGSAPGLTTAVDVHVPATFRQWSVGRFFIQRSLEPQRNVVPVCQWNKLNLVFLRANLHHEECELLISSPLDIRTFQ